MWGRTITFQRRKMPKCRSVHRRRKKRSQRHWGSLGWSKCCCNKKLECIGSPSSGEWRPKSMVGDVWSLISNNWFAISGYWPSSWFSVQSIFISIPHFSVYIKIISQKCECLRYSLISLTSRFIWCAYLLVLLLFRKSMYSMLSILPLSSSCSQFVFQK